MSIANANVWPDIIFTQTETVTLVILSVSHVLIMHLIARVVKAQTVTHRVDVPALLDFMKYRAN